MTTRFAAVTVLGSRPGMRPHTTPVAAIHHADRWWFTTSRHAAKVRLVRRNPVASVTVANATGWTTTTGDAVVLDLADPSSFIRQPAAAVAAAPAALSLLGTYARDVAGYLTQAFAVPSAWLPHQRVLVAISDTLVEHALSPDARHADAAACIAGFSDGRFPVAVPGWFDGDSVTIGTTARPIDADDGIAIMLDTALLDHDPARPGDQRGVLVRGRLVDRVEHGDVRVPVVARTITTWDGFDTATRRFEPDASDAAESAATRSDRTLRQPGRSPERRLACDTWQPI